MLVWAFVHGGYVVGTMSAFDHFDKAHHENFCAALLLLIVEVDKAARAKFEKLIKEKASLSQNAQLLEVSREESLFGATPEEGGRADLVLRFEDDGRKLVLVEVKTHTRWDPEAVASQRQRYEAGRLVGRGEKADAVLLLAPTPLAVLSKQSISWREVIESLQPLEAGSKLIEEAIKHLRKHAAPAPDAGGALPAGVGQSIQVVAALNTLVGDCIAMLKGSAQGPRPYLPTGGHKKTAKAWSWWSIERKMMLDDVTYWVGVYAYDEVPSNFKKGVYLEVYRASDNKPVVAVPLEEAALDSERLQAIKRIFKEKWEAVQISTP